MNLNNPVEEEWQRWIREGEFYEAPFDVNSEFEIQLSYFLKNTSHKFNFEELLNFKKTTHPRWHYIIEKFILQKKQEELIKMWKTA